MLHSFSPTYHKLIDLYVYVITCKDLFLPEIMDNYAHTHIIKMNENIPVTDKGKVYGWGNAEYSQLPVRDDSYQINIATELDTRELGHIVDIAAGGSFCMALNSKH